MHAFDASSMIYAWDNYPIEQFPGLWNWMEGEIKNHRVEILCVAFDEVKNKTPECGVWLNENQIVQIPIRNPILLEALRIKIKVGIVDDHYHPNGVGENDILIIAAAKLFGAELVSDEQRQPKPPTEPTKRRIPAVCLIRTIDVSCINFVEYLKQSKAVFR